MEFCLYIKSGSLKAISQKDASVYYPFLKEKRSELVPLLQSFVDHQVRPVFPVDDCKSGVAQLSVVEMDVYIDKQQRVWVVNVNPLDEEMNPGLFSVEEVCAMREDSPLQFRVVEEEGHVLPSEHMIYQLPMDMHHLDSETAVEEFIHDLKCHVC